MTGCGRPNVIMRTTTSRRTRIRDPNRAKYSRLSPLVTSLCSSCSHCVPEQPPNEGHPCHLEPDPKQGRHSVSTRHASAYSHLFYTPDRKEIRQARPGEKERPTSTSTCSSSWEWRGHLQDVIGATKHVISPTLSRLSELCLGGGKISTLRPSPFFPLH